MARRRGGDWEWIDDPWSKYEKTEFTKETFKFKHVEWMSVLSDEHEEKPWDEVIERLRQYPGNETGDELDYYPPGYSVNERG